MELSDSERDSPLWRKLYEHLEVELESARLNLEKVGGETDAIRGRIKAIRNLMDLNIKRHTFHEPVA